MPKPKLILAALLMLAGTAVAQDAQLSQATQVIEITLDSYSITPNEIVVKANTPVTIKITNKASLIPHNFIINAPEAGIDADVDLRAGKSGEATFTPTKAGHYEIICDKKPPLMKSHKDKGMHGMLIVEE